VPSSIKRLAAVLLFCALAVAAGAQEDESYSIELTGRKTWTLRYGLGDPVGLARSGLSVGQLALDQTLAADIRAEALSILSVEAHFDDQQADSLQSLAIRLDTERLDGVLGDFTAEGIGGFAAYGKKMTGLQLEYRIGGIVATGVASKLEGISETKTYVGQKAHDEVTYSAYADTDPPKPRSYKRGISGLHAYPLDVFYVEEFSEVALTFAATERLGGVLERYGLRYLVDVLSEDGSFPLEEWEADVIGSEEQTLLLLEEATDLVRDRLEAAIDRYNEANGLQGDELKRYPFSAGTAYELEFLAEVAADVVVSVDDEDHPILDAVRRRFYDLGREGVVDASLVVEVSFDGQEFDPIADLSYADYDVELYGDIGILELEFPEAFFTDESAIRASFDYAVTGGVFMLGLSIIPGSDRVSLNDAPLKRDQDYMIDYEIGMLVLLVEVRDTDVIRVDYERFAGGIFGTAADYATYFYGVTVDWPMSEHLSIQASLLQSAEDPGSVSDPESVKTMPNRHTVAGITGTFSLSDLRGDFLIAYSDDRFPFDDNARIHRPNEITGIAAAKEYVFLGHRNGLTVKRGDEWTTYQPSHGLVGRSIRALETGDERLFVGTTSGLTVVSLEGLSPLDRIANWTSYYEAEGEGLPSGSVTALYYADGVLWVGTDAGLASVGLAEIDDLAAWQRPDEGIELGTVTALAGDDESLYVGTKSELYRLSLRSGKWERMQGTEGAEIRDLAVDDGALYVASSRGLRSYRDGIGTGWLVLGDEISAVAVAGGSVVYGSEAGLVDVAGETLLAGAAVSTLEVVGEALWIGSRANEEYELKIWAYGAEVDAYGSGDTGIDGRDPFGFVDAAPEEHSAEGFVERVSFHHTGDGFTMSGRVENVSPSYRSIGSLSRSDRTGWELAATWAPSDDADLSFSHEYRITGRLGDEPESAMVNDLSLQWTFGPVLTVNARHETSNDDPMHEGIEASSTSYRFSLRDRLFADRLDMTLSWSDGSTWGHESGDPRRATTLSLSADATILPAWSAQLNWVRPVRSDDAEWSGSENLTVQTGWSGSVGSSDLAVDYTLGWGRSIPGGEGSRDHELELDVDLSPYESAEWTITPSATFGATSDESSVDLDGRLSARGRRGDLSIQGTLRGALSGLGEPVVRENERFSLTASYSGIESLSPSASYSIDRQVANYAEQRQRTIGQSLTGRLKWKPGALHSDELSITLTSKRTEGGAEITARLENSYRLNLHEWVTSWRADGGGYPVVDLRVETDLNGRLGIGASDLDASMSGRLSASFSPRWSGSFGLSYFGGTDSNGTVYTSLMLEATIAIDF